MGMTPDQFFVAFVHGNYKDCQQYPSCVRRAFNAAVSASHLADHYWAYWQKHDQSKVKGFKDFGAFVEDLSKNTDGGFRDIRSISNAYKHLYTSIDPKKAVHSSISSAGAIESISFADEDAEVNVLEEEYPGNSRGNNNESRVVYVRKDGQRMEFMPVLDKIIEHLKNMLWN